MLLFDNLNIIIILSIIHNYKKQIQTKRKACFWGRNEITENWKGHGTLNPEELNAKVIIAKKFGRENPWVKTEKDIEYRIRWTPFFARRKMAWHSKQSTTSIHCQFLLIRMNLPRRGDGCAACFLLSPWASELGFSQVHLWSSVGRRRWILTPP